MNLSPTDLIIIVIILALVFVLAFVIRFELRINRIMRGKRAKDLESVMIALGDHIDVLEERYDRISAQLDNIESRLHRSIQYVHTVRFNPFKDQGGNQSFATALLDEDGNGVVISSLYSREKVSVYAKPLARKNSEYELSKEEKEAITRAAKS